MFECVYTDQKKKKLKKWSDGFIEKKDQKLIIYKDNKTFIYSTQSYTIEDDMIDTPLFIIQSSFTDRLNHLNDDINIKSDPSRSCFTDRPDHLNDDTNIKSDLSESINDLNFKQLQNKKDDSHLKQDTIMSFEGRSSQDILKLFRT